MITTLPRVKLALGIEGTDQDNYLNLLIELVEADYLNIRNKPFDLDDEGKTVYPDGAESVAIRMISYHLTVCTDAGIVASESLSRHSRSYQAHSGSGASAFYPVTITGGIKRYVEFL